MGLESKGRAWFGKIYNKLETLLVEVDSFTSQSTLCLKPSGLPGFESVRCEPKEVAEQGRSSVSYNVKQHHDDRVASPRCESLFDPPSHQNFDMPGHVVVERRVQEDIFQENLSASSFPNATHLVDEEQLVTDEESQVLSDGETHSTSSLLEEYHDANLTSAITTGDEEPIVTDEESQVLSDAETLFTSPLREEYHDANLTSSTTVDEETIVTDEESHITNTLTPQKFSDQPKEVAEDSSSEASIMQQDHDPVDSPSCKTPSDQPKEAAEDSSSEASVVQQDHDPVDSPSCKTPSDQPKEAAEDSSSEASVVQQDHDPVDSPSCKTPSDQPKEAAEDSSSEASVVQQDHDPVDSPSCKTPSDQPKEAAEDSSSEASVVQQDHDPVDSPSCKTPSDQPKEAAEDSSSEASVVQQDHDPVDSPSCKTPSDQPKEAAEDSSSEASVVQQDHDPVDSPSCKTPSDQPKEAAEDSSSEASIVQQDHELDSPSCKTPSDPPSHQNFDISEHVLVEERVQCDILQENLVQQDGLKEKSSASSSSSLSNEEIHSTSPFLEEYCDTSQTSASTIGDEESITDDESQITNTLTTQNSSPGSSLVFPGGDSVEEVRVKSSLPDGEILSTSSLFENYCDANLTSTTTLADEEQPIITNDESRITNTFTPHPGNLSVSSCGKSVEEVGDVSCRDFGSTESQSTQSSMKSFGTEVKCNDDPVLPALGIFTDNDSSTNDPLSTKIADVPVQDNVANMRSSNADVMNEKSDVAPLDINALYHIDFREDSSYVDNNAMRVKTISPLDTNALNSMQSREDPLYVDDSVLYAMHLRTKKLRSFKRKILDALTSKRRREKEYEQLAIWFGDAEMGSDLATGEDSKQVKAMDSKSSQLLESEDSQWELL
ncbi:PREDICTED: uncharacterized protein LOC104712921 isoform X2 [Camelina sativa]|uniref:Uncharacterized protein LOC104712921 isoform X2 n=1 Tax=Camelina sativa TaxID=90675 RepID=A0ABM0TLQ3_CAMSA|nr:PREDICTED: uncharacterized protein LOC104712921 isoform X2 [Camelina sativa]